MTSFHRAWIPESWKRRSLKRNVVMSWLTTLVTAALSFALIPLVVATLEQEVYGVWTFLNGLAAYSNLFYLGLGASFLKRLSEAASVEDVPALERLLGVASTIYFGLGLLSVALGLGLSTIVADVFATPLSPDAARAASITTALVGVRLLFVFVNSAFSALLAAHGRMDLALGVALGSALTRSAGVAWSMTRPNPLVTLAVVTTLEVSLQLPVLIKLCRLVAPAVRLRPAVPTREELRSLYGFGLQAFFVQASLLIISYTDTALIGVVLGAASVALYAVPLQLVEYSRMMVNGLTTALLPELAGLRARGDYATLKTVFLRSARTCGAMSVFINVHLVTVGPAFLALWVGEAFTDEAPRILLFLGIAATLAALSTQVLIPFYQSLDMLKVLVVIILAEAALNVALSVWFATAIGVWGVALASAVPALVITMVLAPRYMLPRLDVTSGEFFRHVLLPVVALAATCVVTQQVLSLWLGLDSYGVMAVRVACSVVASAPVVALTFPRRDWMPVVVRLAPGLAGRL